MYIKVKGIIESIKTAGLVQCSCGWLDGCGLECELSLYQKNHSLQICITNTAQFICETSQGNYMPTDSVMAQITEMSLKCKWSESWLPGSRTWRCVTVVRLFHTHTHTHTHTVRVCPSHISFIIMDKQSITTYLLSLSCSQMICSIHTDSCVTVKPEGRVTCKSSQGAKCIYNFLWHSRSNLLLRRPTKQHPRMLSGLYGHSGE